MVVWLFCFPKQNFAKSDLQAAIPNRTSPRLEKQKRVAGPRRRARNQAGKAGKPTNGNAVVWVRKPIPCGDLSLPTRELLHLDGTCHWDRCLGKMQLRKAEHVCVFRWQCQQILEAPKCLREHICLGKLGVCTPGRHMLPRGLEPRTLRLLAVRSIQLSYESW